MQGKGKVGLGWEYMIGEDYGMGQDEKQPTASAARQKPTVAAVPAPQPDPVRFRPSFDSRRGGGGVGGGCASLTAGSDPSSSFRGSGSADPFS
jgi:hypothetical protein